MAEFVGAGGAEITGAGALDAGGGLTGVVVAGGVTAVSGAGVLVTLAEAFTACPVRALAVRADALAVRIRRAAGTGRLGVAVGTT